MGVACPWVGKACSTETQNAARARYNPTRVKGEKIGRISMDLTRCPKCGKRMVPVVTFSGRTNLQCISCDDPAVKWAESPLIAPEKPIIAEPLSQPASAEAT
jgi:hypothetical protein